jgi:IS30 family transposase
MGTTYAQLSIEDRCRIASLQEQGRSIRQIAAALGRAPSTIARELKRNAGRQVGYRPGYADEQTRARRWKGSKLERDQCLGQAVLDRLGQGWSPEQVAGRLARERQTPTVSHETIYRFIYAQIARTKDYSWRHYLPRAKSKRGRRGVRGGSSVSFIEGRIPLSQRPAEAGDRQTPGHWEADLMMFAKYGQAILTVHERTSRILLAARPDNKTANLIAEQIEQLLRPIPAKLRRTITFDNVLRQEVWHPERQQISLR